MNPQQQPFTEFVIGYFKSLGQAARIGLQYIYDGHLHGVLRSCPWYPTRAGGSHWPVCYPAYGSRWP